MSLCIRQRSNRNDDSVSVEELDWSAESQVLIPAEHFCVNLNADLEPKINYQTPMTCTYGKSFHTLQNCCNRGGNNIFKYTNYVSIFVATVPFSLLKKGLSPYFCPYNECTSHWCLVIFGSRSAFKSHQRCSIGIRTWLELRTTDLHTARLLQVVITRLFMKARCRLLKYLEDI